ncbi:hypothetical protein ACHAXS_012894 [Conticribra weissflogii]
MVARSPKRSASGGMQGQGDRSDSSEFNTYDASNRPHNGGDIVVFSGMIRRDRSNNAPPEISSEGESSKTIPKLKKTEGINTNNTKQKSGNPNVKWNQPKKNRFQQRGKKGVEGKEPNHSNPGLKKSEKSLLERIELKCETPSDDKKDQRKIQRKSAQERKVPKITVLKRDGAGTRNNCEVDDIQSKNMPQ